MRSADLVAKQETNWGFKRTPAAHALRLIFISGIAAIVIAAIYALAVDAPDWIVDEIYISCVIAGFGTVGLWFCTEVILFFTCTIGWRVWLISIAVAAMTCPWLYVLPASVYGADVADESTWHLLPLFTVLHMVAPTVILGGVSAIVIVVFHCICKSSSSSASVT